MSVTRMCVPVFFIRHGRTAGNLEHRYVGATDEPLCEEGVQELLRCRQHMQELLCEENTGKLLRSKDELSQCKEIWPREYGKAVWNYGTGLRNGSALRENGKSDLACGRVYTSPMLRCVQTAKLLFPNIRPYVVEDFREMGFGEFEYKNYAELSGDARYQAYIDSGGVMDFPGAETQERFRARVREAFEQCVMDNGLMYELGPRVCGVVAEEEASMAGRPEKPFVFCVHGGTIMAILDAYSVPHRDYFEWQVPNASGFSGVLMMEKNGISLREIKRLFV